MGLLKTAYDNNDCFGFVINRSDKTIINYKRFDCVFFNFDYAVK